MYLGAWYEWGGKNPKYLNGTMVSRTQAANVSESLKYIWDNNISGFYASKPFIYDLFDVDVPQGYSMGIDCSGLARIAFNADPDKLMDDLPDGSHDQMEAFSNAEKNYTGILHTNFNQILEGDLVFDTRKAKNKQGEIYDRAKHVMIATGKLDKDKDGNVTRFEVIHASNHGKGARTAWIDVKDHQRIGHTFRGGHAIADISGTGILGKGSRMSWNDFYNWVSRNNLWDKFK
jgi:hypothetical protein